MNFDRLAPHYRWMEAVGAGGKLQRCRLAWLDDARDCREVLVVGEGPGRFLAECARKLSQARILCVDASGAMLARARAAWEAAGGEPGRARFVQATLPEWSAPREAFDLVVTHFVLDCFPAEPLTRVVAQLAAAARPGARWLLAEFREPDRGLTRLRARLVLAGAYAFFRIAAGLPATRLTAPDPYLEAHGFHLRRRLIMDWGMLHSDLWARP